MAENVLMNLRNPYKPSQQMFRSISRSVAMYRNISPAIYFRERLFKTKHIQRNIEKKSNFVVSFLSAEGLALVDARMQTNTRW